MDFLNFLNNQKHDKFYQDIILNGKQVIKGYSQSSETWKRIKEVTTWARKKVISFGCFHGYFLFMAEKEGAEGSGFDRCLPAINVAKEIARRNNSSCKFFHKNISTEKLDYKADIIFVLNMLHHTEDKEKTLDNVFKNCAEAIFEINNSEINLVRSHSKKYGFELINQINSHRNSRIILHFKEGQK